MDFGSILGSLIESGLSGSTQQRAQKAFAVGGVVSGGNLSDLLGTLGDVGGALSGILGGGKGGQGIGGMLGDVLGQTTQMLGGNSNLNLGSLGDLASSLMGGGGKPVSGSLGNGAMALLGAISFSAFKDDKDVEDEVPLGLRQPQNSQEQEQLDNDTELVLKAMINAAKADGRIGDAEMKRITGKFEESDADAETRDFVMNEMKRPADLRGIIAAVGNRPQLAAQVYAASLLAIEVDTAAEKKYMDQLADGLGLSRQTVSILENAVGL